MSDDDLIRRGDAIVAVEFERELFAGPSEYHNGALAGIFHAAEAIAALPAVSAPVAVRVEEIAAALWKAEVTDSGTPQSVIDARTPEAFAEQSEYIRKKWTKFARAAMTAIDAPAPVAPAPQPSFMEQQIARALANTRPVGVTTYGAAAALQSAGVEAAEQAAQGYGVTP